MADRIVSEQEVHDAVAFLRDNARDLGKAKARVVRAGNRLKHIEALEFKASDAGSAEKKKADARTSDNYLEAIEEDAQAAGAYECMKALREAAVMLIEAWRSESATYRSMKI
jgi:hypothetical protein